MSLILSTIPILEETCYPVITVNPLLPDQDQKKIKAFIQQNNQSLLRPNFYFFRNVEIDSDIELITFLAQSIIQQGYAPDEFLPLTIKGRKSLIYCFWRNDCIATSLQSLWL